MAPEDGADMLMKKPFFLPVPLPAVPGQALSEQKKKKKKKKKKK